MQWRCRCPLVRLGDASFHEVVIGYRHRPACADEQVRSSYLFQKEGLLTTQMKR
jgi:hypothetical protein